MIRLVALADTHLRHDSLVVPGGDVLVHAGDLLQHGTLEELERAAEFLRGLPHAHKIVVAGNHDVCLARRPAEARAILAAVPRLVYLEDAGAEVCGLSFWGSPWQPRMRARPNFWAFGAARGEELAAKWARIPPRVDVLVTHGPPYGMGDRVAFGTPGERDAGHARARAMVHVGCADLARRVAEVAPRVHLFGHIHQDPGRWERGRTTYANVTCDEGAVGASVFDL